MQTFWVTALVGLSLVGTMNLASAQSGRDYEYSEREYGSRGRSEREYGSRGYDYDDRDRRYGNDRGRERSREYDDDDDDDDRQERDRSYDNDRGSERGRGYDEDRQRGRRYDGDERGPEQRRRYDDDQGQGRDRGDREEREAKFDEDEYLRCYPDVRRAVERGEMKSGEFHYRTFGRREGRRLTCPTKI